MWWHMHRPDIFTGSSLRNSGDGFDMGKSTGDGAVDFSTRKTSKTPLSPFIAYSQNTKPKQTPGSPR